MNGDVQLVIPDMPGIMERSMDSVADDEALLTQLESSLDQWTPAIAELLETQQGKKPVGRGPLPEVNARRNPKPAQTSF